MGAAAKLLIQDYEDPSYDPFTASARIAGTGVVTEIYPEINRLRRAHPVWEGDLRTHFGTAPDGTMGDRRRITVLGHKEVTAALTDVDAISNSIYENNLGKSFGRSITVMDPPEHRGFRMLFQRAFMPKMIAHWGETLVPDIINTLIDRFIDRGKADLATEFALHFPFHFINELLQLPEDDRATFHKLAFGQTTMRFDPEHALEAGAKLKAYLGALVEDRRSNPLGENDFVTALTKAEVEGERLTELVLISFLRQLMNAGGDTSYHGFTNVLTGLLTNAEQLEAVRQDRSLVNRAINEGLRWECPVLILDRTPHRRMEIGGIMVDPDDHLGICLGAANHDEQAYQDPDRFDIFRKERRHVAFGSGAHLCIGQHLATLEMTVALNALLDRLPNLRIDPDKEPPVVQGMLIRGAKHVDVAFG